MDRDETAEQGTMLQISLDKGDRESESSSRARGSIVSNSRVEFGQWLFKIEREREERERERSGDREMCNDATRCLSMHDIRSVFNGRNVSLKAIDSITEITDSIYSTDNCNDR